MITKQYNGQLLKSWMLEEIADNYELTFHAKERIRERLGDANIKNAILNNVIAYFNYDGSINIAINDYEYFVFIPNEERQKYVCITFKEKSLNGINIYEKYHLAQVGWKRKGDEKWENRNRKNFKKPIDKRKNRYYN